MNISRAKYFCYRNLKEVNIQFTRGVNVLWGLNGQGKSNILEGIYYFARGRSFRGAKDRDLIMFGEAGAACEIEFCKDKIAGALPSSLKAEISLSGRKKLMRNGAALRGSAEMLGSFRAVLFCPSHLSIVNGGPAERRSFIDIAIAQSSADYVYYLSNYRRFLSERNALLKRYASGKSVLREEWETYAEQLSMAAAEIYASRSLYSNQLTGDVKKYFSEMTGGKEDPCLEYVALSSERTDLEDGERPPSSDILYDKLMSNIEREAAAGSTLWGPHKDDIKITINGKAARIFASQGQQRSIALAMKLAEGEISKRVTGEYPVFLLDDVFSELDENRRKYIMEELSGRQIIVTSCEPSVVPSDGSGSGAKYFEVSGGRIADCSQET